MKPKVCVLRTDGTNCDRETAYAFNLVGGDAEIVHINSLKKRYDPVKGKEINLDDYQILALPGGFSHGDYIAAGKVLAEDLRDSLGDEISKFFLDEKLIIGICNGFQVLVKAGFLPMTDGLKQNATLTYNDSNRFEDRWIKLVSPENKCIWTKGINEIYLPVAHGEGKFIASEEIRKKLFEQGLVVYQYADSEGKPTMNFPANPNGSLDAIAGICDPTGRIFGLMPHPERYNNLRNYNLFTLQDILNRDYIDKNNPLVAERLKLISNPKEAPGLEIFRNGIRYFK